MGGALGANLSPSCVDLLMIARPLKIHHGFAVPALVSDTPIYGGFKGGFGIADLEDARALLDQLA